MCLAYKVDHVYLCISTDNHRRKETAYQGTYVLCGENLLHVHTGMYTGEGEIPLITFVSDLS